MSDSSAEQKKLEQSLRYETDTERFKAALAETPEKDRIDALYRIATDERLGMDDRLKKAGANFLEKVALLSDAVAAAHDRRHFEKIFVAAAGRGDPAIFPLLLERGPSNRKRDEAFAYAAGGANVTDNFATENIRTLIEHHTISDDLLFKALEASVTRGTERQLKTLVKYAQQRNPALINRETEKHNTLIEKALTNDHVDIDTRVQLVLTLVEAGAIPPSTVGGVDIVSFMTEKTFPHYAQKTILVALEAHGGLERGELMHRYETFAARVAPQPKIQPQQGRPRSDVETGERER